MILVSDIKNFHLDEVLIKQEAANKDVFSHIEDYFTMLPLLNAVRFFLWLDANANRFLILFGGVESILNIK